MCSNSFVAEVSFRAPIYCPSCAPLADANRIERKNAARRVSVRPEMRDRHLAAGLRRRGLTIEQFAEMLRIQQNRCAICGDLPDPNGIKAASRLHVDHNHTTGLVRALLCGRCNQGLGYFRDDPSLLHLAADYLERHNTNHQTG